MNNFTLSEQQQFKGSQFSTEYFSGCDINVYINHKKAVEVVGLEFSVQEQVEPIFGYASYTYNKLVKGSRFVSGILTINYTTKNYLIDLLGSPPLPKNIFTVDSSITNKKISDKYIDDVEGKINLFWIDSSSEERNKRPFIIENNNGANIKILFGSNHKTEANTSREIVDARFFNPSISTAVSGETIFEHYQFIAKDYL